MKRPLAVAVLYFIAGIIIGQYFTLLFAIPIAASVFIIYHFCRWKAVFIFLVFFFFGYYIINVALMPKNGELDTLHSSGNATVSGVVLECAQTDYGYRATIRANKFEFENAIIKDKIDVQIYTDEALLVQQPVVVRGELTTFDFQRNPYGFNEFLYYKTRHIEYKMKAKIISTSPQIKNFKLFLHDARLKLETAYDKCLPQKEAGIMKAYVLGDTSYLDEDIKTIYKKAGLYHVLAISGSHITLLTEIFYFVLLKLKMRKRTSSVIVIVGIVLFTLLTGSSIATVRAMVMAVTMHFGTIIFRKSDGITSIAIAAFALLVYQPLFLWDAGFLLSFSAVIGLMWLVPLFTKKLFMPKALQTHIVACVVATFVTYPILSYYFFSIPLMSVFVNVLLLPLTASLLIIGLIIGVLGLFSAAAVQFFGIIVYSLLQLFEVVCNLSISLSFSTLMTGKAGLITIAAYYAVIICFAYRERLYKKYIAASYAFFCICIVVTIVYPVRSEVVFLDVGQGDCTLVRASGANVLIDGGGSITREIGDNVGIRTVFPYLQGRRISELDAVFISHPDGDHIIGIIELLDLVKIKALYVSDVDLSGDEMYNLLCDRANDIPIIKISAGTTINVGNDLSFSVAYPKKDMHYTDINTASTVMQMNFLGKTFLFTGDIEAPEENTLVEMNLKSDILKVAHHGSKTSSGYDVIKSISPSAAIIGVGKNNTYGHPAAVVLETFSQLRIPVYTTADNGTLTFTVKDDILKLSAYKGNGIYERAKGQFKIW